MTTYITKRTPRGDILVCQGIYVASVNGIAASFNSYNAAYAALN